MKKIIILFLVLLVNYQMVKAQFSVLVENGINYGQTKVLFSGESELTVNAPVTTYFIGIKPRYHIRGPLLLGLDLQYSHEGYQDFSPHQNQTHINYFRVIPQAEISIWGPLSIVSGVNFGYVLSDDFTQELGTGVICVDMGWMEGVDMGLNVGLNLNIARINLSLKYNYGINSFQSSTFFPMEDARFEYGATRARFVQVGIGYLFGSRN